MDFRPFALDDGPASALVHAEKSWFTKAEDAEGLHRFFMNSPKAQAEAMAREIRTVFYRDIHASKKTCEPEGDELEVLISTALEKLLADIESQKAVISVMEYNWKDNNDYINRQCGQSGLEARCAVQIVVNERDNLQSQLTATEARLETAKAWLEHSPSCPKFNQSENFIVRPVKQCTCGLSAFLSTLTAEKKEQPETITTGPDKDGHYSSIHLYGAEKKEEGK